MAHLKIKNRRCHPGTKESEKFSYSLMKGFKPYGNQFYKKKKGTYHLIYEEYEQSGYVITKKKSL